MRSFLIIVLSLVLAIACSVQQRKYQKGFYVNWHRSAAHPEKAREERFAHTKRTPAPVFTKTGIAFMPEEGTMVSAGGTQKQIIIKKKTTLYTAAADSCDEIVFRNGDELKARLFEINATEIKYKKCDQPDGPMYVIKKSDVFMVKYTNGTRETFAVQSPPPATSVRNQPSSSYSHNGDPRELHPEAPYALVFGITGFIVGFGSIMAIINGSHALRDIRAQPQRYKGAGMAKAGMILGIVRLAIILLVVMLIVAILFSM